MTKSIRLLCISVFSAFIVSLSAQAPAWWIDRDVINPTSTADDYAAVNQGQVKHIAKQAYEEFNAKMPGGAGATLAALWASPVASTDDYAAVNIGQLKNVAKPFYDRLHQFHYAGRPLASGQVYPWSGSATSADDYALANIGQVKNLFSFDISGVPNFHDPYAPWGVDSDGDGIPDWRELLHGFNPFDPGDGEGQLAAWQRSVVNGGKAPESANALGLLVYTP